MEDLQRAYSNLNGPPHTVNEILDLAGMGAWTMPLGDTANSANNPPAILPRFRTRPTTPPRAEVGQPSTIGLLIKDGILKTPSPEVRETLMGFTCGDTEAAGLTPAQRIRILGQCTDLNLLHWAIDLASSPSRGHMTPPRVHPGRGWPNTYTFSQPLPNLEEAHALPGGEHLVPTSRQGQGPHPALYYGPRSSYQRNGSTLMARTSKATHD